MQEANQLRGKPTKNKQLTSNFICLIWQHFTTVGATLQLSGTLTTISVFTSTSLYTLQATYCFLRRSEKETKLMNKTFGKHHVFKAAKNWYQHRFHDLKSEIISTFSLDSLDSSLNFCSVPSNKPNILRFLLTKQTI